MNIQKLKKSLRARWFSIKIGCKSKFLASENSLFNNIEALETKLANKEKIVVLCSGPSAKKLKASKADFYLVTNDSYKLVQDYSFLYYVNDGYFFRRFLANAPLCKNHMNTLFFYRKEDQLHQAGFNYFISKIKLIKNSNYLISNFEADITSANQNYKAFFDFLNKHKIPIKIQNSGVFLLLFGFYLAKKYDKQLEVYGLDLGEGGKVHFEKGGHVGKSITSDRVKVNTESQLKLIYTILGQRVQNFSNFYSNTN